MRVGTRTVLAGYHQFLLHPLMVAAAWWKLYGFPFDPRLWFAFFLHDIGYIGKPNIDGVEGALHPFDGANLMHILFEKSDDCRWYHFCLYHSRTLANVYFAPLSKLCFADKLAFLLYPVWLLRTLFWFSGELEEYIRNCNTSTWQEWYDRACEHNVRTLKEEGFEF